MSDPRILSEDHLRTLFMRIAHKHLTTSDAMDLVNHVDAITEERDLLRQTVEAAHDYVGTGNATEDFEALAERFYLNTGFMAPGKSEPLSVGTNYELRKQKWQEWLEADAVRIRAAIAAVLKGDES